MNELRILDNLIITKENNNVALEGILKCDCYHNYFYISHTGKQTNGILVPLLVKKDKQIAIYATCEKCGKVIIVYDSKVDGFNQNIIGPKEKLSFEMKNKKEAYEIIVRYNYKKENYKSNTFEECFISIVDKYSKERILYE